MTVDTIINPTVSNQLRDLIEDRSGQKILSCYQCGKCSAGCRAAYAMDLAPRQIMRSIQIGLEDVVLTCNSYWVCLQCQVCSARCPREIDIARVMESLRQMAIAKKSKPPEKEVAVFHRIFLKMIKRYGRLYEAGLAGFYNLLSKHFFANLSLVPSMLFKGKLSILPHKIKGTKKIAAIFDRVKEIENEKVSG